MVAVVLSQILVIGVWSEAKNDLLNLDQFNGVVGVGTLGQTLYLLKYQGGGGPASASSADTHSGCG